jgi:hypothetical protein
VELICNGTHQLLVYADDIYPLGDEADTIKVNTEALIYANRNVGLEIKVEKNKCMLLSHHQSVDPNQTSNRAVENVENFECLGTTRVNRNLNQNEIRRKLNSGSLSSSLLF